LVWERISAEGNNELTLTIPNKTATKSFLFDLKFLKDSPWNVTMWLITIVPYWAPLDRLGTL
jgi:hypothetical protein